MNMKPIESALSKIDGFLDTIKRNTQTGNYELEIGIPVNWVYASNDIISCDVLQKTDKGAFIKISSPYEDVTIDELIEFVNTIISTNSKIAKMEEEFEEKLNKEKEKLEEFAENFYKKLDEVKETSFSNLTNENEENTEVDEVINKELEEKIRN